MSDEKRREALELKIPTYISDKECPHGHGNLRYARNNSCVTCAKLSARRSKSSEKSKKFLRKKKFTMKVVVPPGMNMTNEDAAAFLRACGFKIVGVV